MWIGESSQFLSSAEATIRNVFGICSVLMSCAPAVSKVSGLVLDGHRIGQESLIEDDYTEEEIEDELAPISVQLAYVQQASLADLPFLLTSNLFQAKVLSIILLAIQSFFWLLHPNGLSNIPNYFKLFDVRLLLDILSYFWIFKVILS